jgi:O-antigen ligase
LRPDGLRAKDNLHGMKELVLLSVLIVVAPLFRGGNRPLPLLALELVALALLAVLVLGRRNPLAPLTATAKVALGGVVALPLLSLLPLTTELWAMLPGRAAYGDAIGIVGDSASAWRTASTVSFLSAASALALLPPLAVFLAIISIRERQRLNLVYVFLGMAALQSLLGLAQFGTQDPLLYLGMDSSGGAHGTYPNRNHLPGMLNLAACLAAAMFAADFGRQSSHRRYHGSGLRAAFARIGGQGANRYIFYLALLALIGLAIVFSRSRTGIMLLMLGVLLSALAFAPRLGGRQTMRSAAGVIVLIGGLALIVGLVPVLQRFAEIDPVADARWSIASATVSGIAAFFPLGAGVGTFPEAFRAFHPEDVPRFVNHAHNDYLEWIFEGGLAAGLLLALLLFVYAAQWVRNLRIREWTRDKFIRIGAGIGILLMLLHGFVDYNLRIPANAIYFALLLGLFFAAPEIHERKPHRGEKPKTQSPAPSSTPMPVASAPPTGPNPFEI